MVPGYGSAVEKMIFFYPSLPCVLAPVGVELIIKQLCCQLRKRSGNSCDHIRIQTLKNEEKSVMLTGHCRLATAQEAESDCRQIVLQDKNSEKTIKQTKQNPLAVKTELETNLFQAAYSHSDTNLALPAVLLCQSACFPDKRHLSLLSQVSQCVDSDSGVSGEGAGTAE